MRKMSKRAADKAAVAMVTAAMGTAAFGNAAPHAAYAEAATGGEETDLVVESPLDTLVRGVLRSLGVHVECAPSPSVYSLDANEWATVQAFQAKAQDLLDGNIEGNSTIFEVDGATAFGDAGWTADDLGAEPVIKDANDQWVINAEAIAPIVDLANERVSHIFVAMLNENPARLAWADKTQGAPSSLKWSASYEGGKWTLRVSKLTVKFTVSADCQGSGEYTVSDEAIARINAAVTAAQSIVDAHEEEPLHERLNSYAAEIMTLASYDTAAANTPGTPYGDPWQLTSVLDGDVSTKSVCEGYAKTFRLLTELSEQSSGETILVAGDLTKTNGSKERHMWNIVSTPQGNYLFDVTNSESSTVGHDGELLFGVPTSGSVEDGYTFTLHDGRTLTYEYDENTLGAYTEAALTLATEAYDPYATNPAEPVANYDGLTTMKATIGGAPYEFDPTAAPYTYTKIYDGYGQQENTTVALAGYDTDTWVLTDTSTEVHPPLPSAVNAGVQFDYYTTRYGVTNTFTFTSLQNGEDGQPLTRTYTFKQMWWTKTDLPHVDPDPVADYDGLNGMTLRMGSVDIEEFDPTYEPYGWDVDYGVVEETPDCDVTLTGYDETEWHVTSVTDNTVDTPLETITGGGEGMGIESTGLRIESDDDDEPAQTEHVRTQEYTFESFGNGSEGVPLTRTYTFTATWITEESATGADDPNQGGGNSGNNEDPNQGSGTSNDDPNQGGNEGGDPNQGGNGDDPNQGGNGDDPNGGNGGNEGGNPNQGGGNEGGDPNQGGNGDDPNGGNNGDDPTGGNGNNDDPNQGGNGNGDDPNGGNNDDPTGGNSGNNGDPSQGGNEGGDPNQGGGNDNPSGGNNDDPNQGGGNNDGPNQGGNNDDPSQGGQGNEDPNSGNNNEDPSDPNQGGQGSQGGQGDTPIVNPSDPNQGNQPASQNGDETNIKQDEQNIYTPFKFASQDNGNGAGGSGASTGSTSSTSPASTAGNTAGTVTGNAKNLVQTGDMTVVLVGGTLFLAIGGMIVARHRMAK